MEDTTNLMDLQHEFYDGVNYKNIELEMAFITITRLVTTELECEIMT